MDENSFSSEQEREKWQTELEHKFVKLGVDASLIAALVHEPEQTYGGAHSILQSLSSSSEDKRYTSSDDEGCPQPSGSTPATSERAGEEEDVERLLQEWKLIDLESNLEENLHLTDDDEIANKVREDGFGPEGREARRLGSTASQGLLQVGELAAGRESVARSVSDVGWSGLAFLIHAFPSRTPIFLEEMLKDGGGSVENVIDTLAVMEMVENETSDAARGDPRTEILQAASKAGLDDDLLEAGISHRKSSKNERRRRKEGALLANGMAGVGKGGPQKINLTDIRQGGPTTTHLPRRPASTVKISKRSINTEEDDSAMAARLMAEERKAAGLPPSEKDTSTVEDNDWLFSSSILDQLSELLDMPLHKVRSVHNSCHFNLRATTQRVIALQCQDYPSLASLDEAGSAPEGTASMIVDGLGSLLPLKRRNELERAFRATKGRQDATIDLVQLIDTVENSAVGEKTDVLDPMKTTRNTKEVAVATQVHSRQADPKQGHFNFVGEDDAALVPGEVPYSQITRRSLRNERNAPQSDSRRYALEQLRAGASSTSFPLHSSHLNKVEMVSAPNSTFFDGPRHNETQSEAARLAAEYRTIADEYRNRREHSLMQAAHAYRNLPGGADKQVRGAAAWVYADEARRLDAKARAFSLKAAQATVRHRMLTSRLGSMSASSASPSQRHTPDVVDLHGLTVHESLSITKEALSAWWSKSSSGAVHPLYIVTGVGRHSRGNVAVIRPAILKMLQRDGWLADERRGGQITVKGLR